MSNELIDEVRRHRHEHEIACGFDVDRIFDDLQKRQLASEGKYINLRPNLYPLAPTEAPPCRIAEDATEYQNPQNK